LTDDGKVLVTFGTIGIVLGVFELIGFVLILFTIILPSHPTHLVDYLGGIIGGVFLSAGSLFVIAGVVVRMIGKKERATDVKYCMNCGTQVEPMASFCKNCGKALRSPTAPRSTAHAKPKKDHTVRNIVIAVLVIFLVVPGVIVGFGIFGGLFAFLPNIGHGSASFVATDIQFTNTGTIGIRANITNTSPSQQSLIQVDVYVDGLYDGSCGYGFGLNQTKMCDFTDPNSLPLASCATLPQAQNYTVSFSSFSVPADGTIFYEIYPVTPAELGCS